MSCFKPLEGFQALSGGRLKFTRPRAYATRQLSVGCRQCIGCRISEGEQKSLRMIHEAALWEHNQFVTLTYADEHLPENYSLDHSDFQKFIRALRKRVPGPIRYAMAGEYGKGGSRPHYHAIIYNLELPKDDLTLWRTSEKGYKNFRSQFLESIWEKGYVYVGENVSSESCGYVASYLLKDGKTDTRKDIYWEDPQTGKQIKRTAPYIQFSRRPGIGHDYFVKHYREFYPRDRATKLICEPGQVRVDPEGLFFDAELRARKYRAKQVRVPEYYDRLCKKYFPELWEVVEAKRVAEGRKPAALFEKTAPRLAAREVCAEAKLKQLRRSL